jgi:hypothetical protein
VTHYSHLSHMECSPQDLALDPLDHLSPFASHSTRVTLCDSRRASTMPLTMPSPEPRTIFLRASMEPQATKPSRRWQPPRVTSTTGFQHEHLVPLNAISQCNHTRMTHSLLIHNLASTSELEGSQALSSIDTKSPKVLNLSHGRGALLFIAQRLKIAVSIFCASTGRAGPCVRSLHLCHVSPAI